DVARGGAEADLAGVDGDALVALALQRVEQKRPFEPHAAPRAHLAELVELAVRQAAGLGQQAADQRRFAVVDMADDDDAHQRPGENGGIGDGGRDGTDVHGMGTLRQAIAMRFYRYPATRKRSNASSAS